MRFNKLFERLNIKIPQEEIDILESHERNQNEHDYDLRLLNDNEVIELMEWMSEVEVYRHIVPLWTDDNSNYIGVYHQGTLKYRICYINHEETDTSPGFRSISSFTNSIDQHPDLEWSELNKDYPAIVTVDSGDRDHDIQSIQELNHLLASDELDDDLRCQVIFSIMALTPIDQLESLMAFLDDEDMYVQERACEIMGFHKFKPARDKLEEITANGSHNGKQAAKRALLHMR